MKRWNWHNWLQMVKERVPEAMTVSEAIYTHLKDKPKRKRGLFIYDLDIGWGETQGETVANFLKLSRAGLLSRCPGTPYYAPTTKMDPLNADLPKQVEAPQIVVGTSA